MANADNPIPPYNVVIKRILKNSRDPADIAEALQREYTHTHDQDKPAFVAGLIMHYTTQMALLQLHEHRVSALQIREEQVTAVELSVRQFLAGSKVPPE